MMEVDPTREWDVMNKCPECHKTHNAKWPTVHCGGCNADPCECRQLVMVAEKKS